MPAGTEKERNETMNTTTTETTREVFLRFWHEYAVFNTADVDAGQVVAQGECSGKYYVLTLDNDLAVLDADLYC